MLQPQSFELDKFVGTKYRKQGETNPSYLFIFILYFFQFLDHQRCSFCIWWAQSGREVHSLMWPVTCFTTKFIIDVQWQKAPDQVVSKSSTVQAVTKSLKLKRGIHVWNVYVLGKMMSELASNWQDRNLCRKKRN